MLPTMLLAAMMPCAVPAMERETTAQEATELLRGRWRVVYQENNGKVNTNRNDTVGEFEGRQLTTWDGQDGSHRTMLSVRLIPSGRYYQLVASFARTDLTVSAQVQFRGLEFRYVEPAGLTVWRRQ